MDPNETLRVIRLTVAQMRVDEHPDIRKAHADELAERNDLGTGYRVAVEQHYRSRTAGTIVYREAGR